MTHTEPTSLDWELATVRGARRRLDEATAALAAAREAQKSARDALTAAVDRAADTLPCRYCQAAPGDECTDPHDGQPHTRPHVVRTRDVSLALVDRPE